MTESSNEKWLQIYYQESGHYIRQFNIVRTSIVGFLITIGAGSAIQAGRTDESSWLYLIAIVSFLTATIMSVFFSFLIRQRSEYQKDIKSLVDKADDDDYDYSPKLKKIFNCKILKGVIKDLTNIACIIFVIIILFVSYKVDRKQLNTKSILREQISFSTNKASLSKSAEKVLEKIRSFVRSHPDSIVLLSSNTDTTGSIKININLSKQRTRTVRDALVTQIGIQENRIFSVDLATHFLPIITPDNTDESHNRTVTINLIYHPGI